MAMDFESLAPTRRSDDVFEQLRSRILSGALPAGARLPNERELAQALGVNRGSVREATKRLEFLELVEVRHGHGTFVQELSESSALQLVETLLRDPRTVTRELLRQILEFRRQITLQVVELAATNHTRDQLDRARSLLSDEQATEFDPEAALALDVQMNSLLGEATGNLLYQLVTNLFTKLIRRLGPIYYNDLRDHRRSLETHHLLLAALEKGDPQEARRVVEVMLGYSERAILETAESMEREGLIGPGSSGALS